jgi:ribosome-associated heat shock protein Hsp15
MSATVRLDRWLWAARFFKTRGQAAGAVAGGKVHINGERAKASKAVRPGDRVRVRVGPYEFDVAVRALAERRGPARAASALYEETPESRAARERLAEQHRLAPSVRFEGKGRPTKRDRRRLDETLGE